MLLCFEEVSLQDGEKSKQNRLSVLFNLKQFRRLVVRMMIREIKTYKYRRLGLPWIIYLSVLQKEVVNVQISEPAYDVSTLCIRERVEYSPTDEVVP